MLDGGPKDGGYAEVRRVDNVVGKMHRLTSRGKYGKAIGKF